MNHAPVRRRRLSKSCSCIRWVLGSATGLAAGYNGQTRYTYTSKLCQILPRHVTDHDSTLLLFYCLSLQLRDSTVYDCIHIYIPIYIHTHMHACAHNTEMNERTQLHINAYMHTHTYLHTPMHSYRTMHMHIHRTSIYSCSSPGLRLRQRTLQQRPAQSASVGCFVFPASPACLKPCCLRHFTALLSKRASGGEFKERSVYMTRAIYAC